MFDFNYIRNEVKKRSSEIRNVKSFGVIIFSDFEKMLKSNCNIDLIRQTINLPKTYHSVRVLLQPYLIGKEKKIFGKRYVSLLYKNIPDYLNEEFENFALENKINSYSFVYSNMSWDEVEKKVKLNGFVEEPRFALFLKAWNYVAPKSIYKTNKYEEFIENLQKNNHNR
jgi:hypothetical protein